MEKRVIAAVVLSILVIIFWQRFFGDIQTQKITPSGPSGKAIAPGDSATKITEIPISQKEEIQEKQYVYENAQFVVTFSNVGGCIKKIDLKEYGAADPMMYYNLLSAEEAGRGIFTLSSQGLAIEHDTFEYSRQVSGNTVEYTTAVPGKVRILKSYKFGNWDIIDFNLIFENLSNETQVFDYDLVGGVNIESKEPLSARYIQVDSLVNDNIYRSRGKRDKVISQPGDVKWVSLKNKYFALLLEPLQPANASLVKQYSDRTLASGIRMGAISLSPNGKVEHIFKLYSGPKKPERLKAANPSYERVIHYGVFGGISKALLAALSFFYKITGNWGFSIILLSVCVNIVLYPLSRRSFQSMKEMQKIQPEIRQLQEKYKKNTQKLNKEIMELYRKHKVNPFGGCFPMLLQMPIFIALFQGLSRFIELKQANFLWIKDLSMPDSLSLPFFGDASIHLLPIFMAGTMFFQQKFSHPQHQAGLTEQQKQQQKMMSFMMPVLFGFIFYNFPSGLVLYWFTNTLFMTLQQVLMLKKST